MDDRELKIEDEILLSRRYRTFVVLREVALIALSLAVGCGIWLVMAI